MKSWLRVRRLWNCSADCKNGTAVMSGLGRESENVLGVLKA